MSAAMAPAALYVPRKQDQSIPFFGNVFAAIDARYKMRITYADAKEQATNRIIWPLGAFFWGDAWTVLAWCELREDFRSFMMERIKALEILPDLYPETRGRRLSDYFRWMEKTHAVPTSDFDPH
jgi:predicted DNA-binding transcriptional regulator YafY